MSGSLLHLAPETVSANADLLVFFVVGVLAGAHCLGMCGPLVSVYADRLASRKDAHRNTLTLFEVRQHFLFNVGRTAGYAVAGVVFGLLGATLFSSIDQISTVGSGVRATMGIGVGLLILGAGLGYLFRGTGGAHSLSIPYVSMLFRRISAVLTGHVDRLASSTGILALGGVHAALPCPIIYPAYLYAFAIGDPVRGGLSLAALGLGTLPTLFAYGTMLGTLSAGHRASLHRLLGAAFVLLAYVPLSHGLVLLGIQVPHLDIPYYQPLA